LKRSSERMEERDKREEGSGKNVDLDGAIYGRGE